MSSEEEFVSHLPVTGISAQNLRLSGNVLGNIKFQLKKQFNGDTMKCVVVYVSSSVGHRCDNKNGCH